MPRPGLQQIHERILDVFEKFPDGIDISSMRIELGLQAHEQQHLDRRIRFLYPFYDITKERRGTLTIYRLVGEKTTPLETDAIDRTTRARILHLSGYQCQMCGRSPKIEKVILHVDHKVPRNWGGTNDDDNLWAVCSTCNEGKRNFFASITDERVQTAMIHPSIHVRLGELLKAFQGQEVPKEYLQLVAWTHDDFEKRLRELRELGWKYHFRKKKDGHKVRTYFVLDVWKPWPADPAATIRASERLKGKRG